VLVDVRDAEVWQLVDERLDEMRRLAPGELARRAGGAPETEVLEHDSGRLRRRTRVVTLGADRLGITVLVDADGRRPRAEGGIVVTTTGELAPEWSRRGDPPLHNPFVFGPRVTLAGLAVAILVLALFFLLV
jgi:hypothetical protein